MSQERAKPFVGWMTHTSVHGGWGKDEDGLRESVLHGRDLSAAHAEAPMVPVVVTPLLPDDPRPGDKMVWHVPGYWDEGVTIAGASWAGQVPCIGAYGKEVLPYLTSLRRPPASKTFRLRMQTGRLGPQCVEVRAESREAALAKLADALEEL